METKQIKKLYQAMTDHGFSCLDLKLGENDRIKIVTDNPAIEHSAGDFLEFADLDDDNPPHPTQVEIRSDKVGVFAFSDRRLQPGDHIKKGETIGLVKGISFQERIKCSLDGIISRVEVAADDVVDYGRLLFVVDID